MSNRNARMMCIIWKCNTKLQVRNELILNKICNISNDVHNIMYVINDIRNTTNYVFVFEKKKYSKHYTIIFTKTFLKIVGTKRI